MDIPPGARDRSPGPWERPVSVALPPARRDRDIRLETPLGGLKVLQQLKADPDTTRIPIIICSGDAWILHDNQDVLDAHAAAVLIKPFSVDDVYQAVEAVLPPTYPRGVTVPDSGPAEKV